jgi:CheY-like chemotaxis protein
VVDQQFLGTVLLVEDEPLVRLVAADILVDANFRVIEAANADEALTVLKAGVQVDVLLSDVEMPPGMNGYELAKQVSQGWPTVEILLSSGREWPREADLPPGAAFLAKPCPNSALVAHVQAAAGRAQAARYSSTRSDEPGIPDQSMGTPVPKTA